MIRPELFTHESLFAAEKASGLPLRFAFIGLWTQCDREGRFEWRPLRLKLAIMPWDEGDFESILIALANAGFLVRYEIDGKPYCHIPSWHRNQRPHHQEAKSTIPPPPVPSRDGEKIVGESPKSFAPSPEATPVISAGIRNTNYGDGVGDETSRGEKPPDGNELTSEWVARKWVMRSPDRSRAELERAGNYFRGMNRGNDECWPVPLDEIAKEVDREDRRTEEKLWEFGKRFLKKYGRKPNANGKLSSEAMSNAVLAAVTGGEP
jgi:hypothetical protein